MISVTSSTTVSLAANSGASNVRLVIGFMKQKTVLKKKDQFAVATKFAFTFRRLRMSSHKLLRLTTSTILIKCLLKFRMTRLISMLSCFTRLKSSTSSFKSNLRSRSS